MNIEPIGTRVVIKVEEAQKKTATGIIIPDSGKEKPTVGTIVAINNDTKLDFKVDLGTKLLFSKFAGTELEIEGQKLLIMEMDEALAIIRD